MLSNKYNSIQNKKRQQNGPGSLRQKAKANTQRMELGDMDATYHLPKIVMSVN